MNEPTLEQLRTWRGRLMQMASEMEAVYGPPGEMNQDALDAAVHVAVYVACDKFTLADLADERREMSEKRAKVVREIQRTRLGGADRIIVDDEEPFGRYAHIYSNALGTNLHTTDAADKADEVYADDSSWRFVGVIDLDTGDVSNVLRAAHD